MNYSDKYHNCNGCPVEKYCGTVISATRLCQAFNDDIASKEAAHVLTLSEAALNADSINEKITMWDNITD